MGFEDTDGGIWIGPQRLEIDGVCLYLQAIISMAVLQRSLDVDYRMSFSVNSIHEHLEAFIGVRIKDFKVN